MHTHTQTERVAADRRALAAAAVLVGGLMGSEGVAGLVFRSAIVLLRESTRIFMEGSPGEIDPDAVGRAVVGEDHVVEVHDLHVWTVTSGFPALAAHVLVEPGADCHGVRRRLERLLADRFGLTHTTLQVDHAAGPRQAVQLGEPYRRETPV